MILRGRLTALYILDVSEDLAAFPSALWEGDAKYIYSGFWGGPAGLSGGWVPPDPYPTGSPPGPFTSEKPSSDGNKGDRSFPNMSKSTQSLPRAVVRRLKGRPYYCYLYAVNVLGGRLPAILEGDLALDPQSAYLYARDVVGGHLPDAVHNALVMGSFGENSGAEWVGAYLELVK